MAVPKEYLKVPRPKNTICKMIGDKCAVIERIGCKRVNGKNIPINGKVIGHIIDGVYVEKKTKSLEVTLKNYGDYAFANLVGSSLLDELREVYDDQISKRIYAISLLRAVNPRLTDCQIDDEYEESFISNDMPGLKLGRTAVSTLIESLGKDYAKILRFMNNRVEKIDEDNRIAIDGMLSINNSKVNSLCDFSFKSKVKSTKQISQIIAFNVTTKEIICSLPYPGNTVDIVSFPDFIEKTGIKKGVVITDKAGARIDTINSVGYIHPLKRNSKISTKLKLYDMDEKLDRKDEAIQCKKAYDDERFYYAFRDIKRAAKEKSDFMKSSIFTIEKLKSKEDKFGTVVYVSDQDLTCKEAYEMYSTRWEIELVNKFYNSTCILTVREHSDFSLYGTEFINQLAMIIGNRMKNRFAELNLFEDYTYGELMKILKRHKKCQSPTNSTIWHYAKQSEKGEKVIKKLGI